MEIETTQVKSYRISVGTQHRGKRDRKIRQRFGGQRDDYTYIHTNVHFEYLNKFLLLNIKCEQFMIILDFNIKANK